MFRTTLGKSLLALAIGAMTLTMTGDAMAKHHGNRGNGNRGNVYRANGNRGNFNRPYNNSFYGGNFNKGGFGRPYGTPVRPARPVYGAGGWNGYGYGRPSTTGYGGRYNGWGGANFNRNVISVGGIGISW